MKIIFSLISRLFFSYSKFLSTLVFISTLGTSVNASEPKYTYLKCVDRYYRLNGNYLSSNYNIRTKKFKNHYEVTDYKTARCEKEISDIKWVKSTQIDEINWLSTTMKSLAQTALQTPKQRTTFDLSSTEGHPYMLTMLDAPIGGIGS